MKDLIQRALYSILKVQGIGRKNDILLKFNTFYNLFLKFLGKPPITWKYDDCLAKARFFSSEYLFQLSKNHDFNKLLNPYFHEYDVTSLVWSLLQENDIFIDVGAHAGLYTLIGSLQIKDKGIIISIEPHPVTRKYLKNNIILNKINNVKIIPKALGESSKTIKLFYHPSELAITSAHHDLRTYKSFEVEVTTLDQIYREFIAPKKVKLIKIDTEGYDLQVLKGGKNTIQKTQCIIVEENTEEIKYVLKKYGFKLQILSPSNYLFATRASEPLENQFFSS